MATTAYLNELNGLHFLLLFLGTGTQFESGRLLLEMVAVHPHSVICKGTGFPKMSFETLPYDQQSLMKEFRDW